MPLQYLYLKLTPWTEPLVSCFHFAVCFSRIRHDVIFQLILGLPNKYFLRRLPSKSIRISIFLHPASHCDIFDLGAAQITNFLMQYLTYRSDAKQWLCKQQPLLCSARNTHARNNWKRCFYVARPVTVAMQGRRKHTSTRIGGCVFCVVNAKELPWSQSLRPRQRTFQ
jgi:hypothetical protein